MTRVLAVRLDSDGDVLLTGPAVRALAAVAAVDLLVSPAGRHAGAMLPGVRDLLTFDAPWSGYRPPAVDPVAVARLVAALEERRYDLAVVFTSFHQSPLPTALLLKLAGVRTVAATAEDYPGSLLDLRHHRPDGLHEVRAALDLAHAAGGRLPAGDDGRLAVRTPLPDVTGLVPGRRYVALHPGASVPARAPLPGDAGRIAAALAGAGWPVAVTGGPTERALTARVAGGGPGIVDLGGRTDLPRLAAVLAGAAAVVVGNTGPAHLAAAVGTPVVSLFAPVVPSDRWAPYGVPAVLLGDPGAPCAGSRARVCPVPGHPCLSGIDPVAVVAAVERLVGAAPATAAARGTEVPA